MNFDLTRLKSNIEDQVTIHTEYEIDKELLKTTDLIAPFKVQVDGFIKRDLLDSFLLDVTVNGVMTLPCSITLEPVSVPFTIKITGSLEELLSETLENHKKIENSIDILPIIWENILMEIPMKVTSPNAYLKKTEGDGWKFVTEGEGKEINPALEKLKDLL